MVILDFPYLRYRYMQNRDTQLLMDRRLRATMRSITSTSLKRASNCFREGSLENHGLADHDVSRDDHP